MRQSSALLALPICVLIGIVAFAAEGDVLFYRRGIGETDWTAPAFSEKHGLFYLGFAFEPEEATHSCPGVICWDRSGVEQWRWELEQPTGGLLLNAAQDRLYFGTFGPSLGPSDLGFVYCFSAVNGKHEIDDADNADAISLGSWGALADRGRDGRRSPKATAAAF